MIMTISPSPCQAGDNSRLQGRSFSIDSETRAYWVAVTNSIWLDFLGTLLILAVSIHTHHCYPAFCISCSNSVTLSHPRRTPVENNMNSESIRRAVYYAQDLDHEPPHESPEANLVAHSPSEGKLGNQKCGCEASRWASAWPQVSLHDCLWKRKLGIFGHLQYWCWKIVYNASPRSGSMMSVKRLVFRPPYSAGLCGQTLIHLDYTVPHDSRMRLTPY